MDDTHSGRDQSGDTQPDITGFTSSDGATDSNSESGLYGTCLDFIADHFRHQHEISKLQEQAVVKPASLVVVQAVGPRVSIRRVVKVTRQAMAVASPPIPTIRSPASLAIATVRAHTELPWKRLARVNKRPGSPTWKAVTPALKAARTSPASM